MLLVIMGFLVGACIGEDRHLTTPTPITTSASSLSSQPARSTGDYETYLGIDFENPVDGSPVASIAVARQGLEFAPVLPKGVGALESIWVGWVRPRTGKASQLGLVYSSPHFGMVDVVESVPAVQGDEWADYVKEVGAQSRATEDDPDSLGSAELVRVGDGVPALLTMTEEKTHASIQWLHHTVKLWVVGPLLDRRDVLAIANRIERGSDR